MSGQPRGSRPRELDGDEHERCFQHGVEINPSWVQYRETRATPPHPGCQADQEIDMTDTREKSRQGAMWGSGDYQRITETIPDIHELVIERLNPQPGLRWLDLACGTGAVAERAAARGADVTGIDLAPCSSRPRPRARRGSASRSTTESATASAWNCPSGASTWSARPAA